MPTITTTTIIVITIRRSLSAVRRARCNCNLSPSLGPHPYVLLLIPDHWPSFGLKHVGATIRSMKRIVAAILLCASFATPSFAAKHPHRHHKKIDMTYKAPKSYKVHVHKQKQKHHHPA